jgi:hypothetical protein
LHHESPDEYHLIWNELERLWMYDHPAVASLRSVIIQNRQKARAMEKDLRMRAYSWENCQTIYKWEKTLVKYKWSLKKGTCSRILEVRLWR